MEIDTNELLHSGKKGMKWGYNDGVPNGKRTAGEEENSLTVTDDTEVMIRDGKFYFSQPDGTYQTVSGDTYEERDVDDWLSSTFESTTAANLSTRKKKTVKNVGKIERGFKNFINKGSEFLDKLFG